MLKAAVFVAAVAVLCKGLLAAVVEVQNREVMVLPGQSATFKCHVGVPLQYCRIEVPGFKTYNLNKGTVSSDVEYYGNGLDAGDCGFTILHVQNKNNGNIQCTLGIPSEETESIGTMQLVVAKAPLAPEIDLNLGTDSLKLLKVGDTLEASCIVRDGRPVANISWYLDNDPITDVGVKMPTVLDFAKENLQTKVQNLTKMLRASDNGKHLRCVAEHPAYPQGFAETKRLLDITFPPQPSPESLDKFGYQIGREGLINVTFQANPRPQVKWQIGAEVIKEGETDSSGLIIAEALRDLGRGLYVANLRVARISKQDTDKDYILSAYNNVGTETYRVKISTSPEPEGVDWAETGTIIGVVVTVLVIILVVSILIFAKVTGRWCFSGGSDTRNLGESSDTESADVRPRDSRRETRPLKLTSFFRKNKDRVASEEEPEFRRIETEEEKKPPEDAAEENPSAEPKEGLVYAELDLVRADLKPVVKNDDEKTEYAEIVYTPSTTAEEEAKAETPPTK